MKSISVLCFLCCLHSIFSYQILGLNPYNGKSHFVMFGRLYKELAARGHKVDVVSYFPQKNKIENYTDLSLEGSLPSLQNTISYDFFKELNLKSTLDVITELGGRKICEAAFRHPVVRKLKSTKKKYDLIVVEIFGTDCMYGFAYHFDIPVVTLTTSVNLPWGNSRFGNPHDPTYVPSYFSTYTDQMNLFEKLWNYYYYFFAQIHYYWKSVPVSDETMKEFFGQNIPTASQLLQNYSSLLLVNSHFSLQFARPWVPNVIEVGGMHLEDPQPLNEEYKEIVSLENKYKGVVYLSFGSLVVFDTLPENILKTFFETFSLLSEYKILLKGDASKLPKTIPKPPNVIFKTWMPQLDLLCSGHQDVVLFISHGGLMGTIESVHCGVPILVIPLFADQEANANNLVSKGIAEKLSLKEMNKVDFYNSVSKLLMEPSYKNKAKVISAQFRDRPMSPLDTAIYWIEYVVRHKGAKQLRSQTMEMSIVQYLYLDIISSILLPIFIIYKLIK